MIGRLLAAALTLGLAACASAPKQPPLAQVVGPARPAPVLLSAPAARKVSPYAPAVEDPGKRGQYQAGGLYAPHIADSTPDLIPDVDAIPEPEVTAVPRSRVGNRSSYAVLGKQYRVLDDAHGYVEEGLASYYGNKFHGRRTSNLEVYDMYAFTAAHKSLPLPSFARVTNLDNGKSLTVRVNDRGPFHAGRVIDLSYAAAVKLGITQRGTGRVEVRALTPGQSGRPDYATAVTRQPSGGGPLDRLVAALPINSNAASAAASTTADALPPGVHIATGRPAPTAGASATAAVSPAAPDPVIASPAPASTAAGGHDYRFDMRQDGKAMTANEFDAWMKSRQVRVATGKPGQPDARAATGLPASRQPTAPPPPAPFQAAVAVAATLADAPRDADVTLQVAAFSARGNADRALAMLRGAGIDGARLHDGNANGQKVWRLRVGPLDATAAPDLAARIVGLGFGQPQRVRD